MRQFKLIIASIDGRLCFIHGDALINKLLITEEYPYPILIDMEFPDMIEPFKDIATFCVDAGV